MRIVLQRVKEASVTIDGEVHGAINKGYMILVGFNNDDTHEIIDRLVEKVIHLRVFEDENQKMNRSLIDCRRIYSFYFSIHFICRLS